MEQGMKHRSAISTQLRRLLPAVCVVALPAVAAAYGGPSTRLVPLRAPGLTHEQVRSALGSRVEQMRGRNRSYSERGGLRGRSGGAAGHTTTPPPRDPLPRPGGDLLN